MSQKNKNYIITEKIIKERKQIFENLLNNKNICEIKKVEDKYYITFNDGCIFRCSGKIPEECIQMFFKREIRTNKIVKLF